MIARRGLAALTVATSLLLGVAPVLAQVDEAEQRAREAASDVDIAYEIVSASVADRDAIEAALFTALDRYQVTATLLSEASVRLESTSDALAFADAETQRAEVTLAGQTVTAYMEAVTSTATLVFDSGTVEDALVVGQVVRETQSDALTTLADLIAHRADLERIRAEHAAEVESVSALESTLAASAADLEILFASANEQVAAAYTEAAAADAAYRAALGDVERALAEEEAARRATETTLPPSTTTTSSPPPEPDTTPPTTPPAGTTPTTTTTSTAVTTTTVATTTTTTTSSWPPIPINARVMAWRPLVEQHFAADLVLDALVIIQCESLGDPAAVNPYSGASGLFQFMPGTWAVASVQAGVGHRSVFDGEANIIAAAWLTEYYRDRTGEPWRPWSCRTHL